jgi:hypothetical protein
METKEYVTFAIALLGAVFGVLNWLRSRENTMIFVRDSRESRRLANSAGFLKEYYSPEFMQIRSEAWNVLTSALDSPTSDLSLSQITLYLIGSTNFDPKSLALPEAKVVTNKLTPLQNVSLLVNFWHRLSEFAKAKMVEPAILQPLRHDLRQWERYMILLADQCDALIRDSEDPRLIPPWLSGMKEIEADVWGDKMRTNQMLDRSGGSVAS